MKDLVEIVKRIKTISDVGLLYAQNPYDRERYEELNGLSMEMLSFISDKNLDELKLSLPTSIDYPTAKVDIRGLLLNDSGQILLVREMADNRWSLPGGWADVGFSPQEVVIKEFKEETGIDVMPLRLLAVFDKRKHSHPPQPHYVYKMVFLCRLVSGEIKKGFDVLDVQYFSPDNLPELSEDRILRTQIEFLLGRINGEADTHFD